LASFEELAEELLRRLFIPPVLHQGIEHVSLLIHSALQIVAFAIDRQEDLVQMPFVPWPGTQPPKLIRILLAKLPAPLADRFVGDDDPTDEQQFFHIAVAEREAEIEPDRVADDLTRKPVMFVEIWRG
jgi:hypothetical protein